MALAERVGRPVRLLIVPTRNVVDAIVGTVVRLRSSDIFVGESSTLSALDQARLLGEAWERADKPEALDVRLVVYHASGRGDTFHLGAHPPSLASGDLDLIHRMWLDAVKTIGPHVHHHDVVRAALRKMEHELTGPHRDDAMAAIRDVARPAEELAAIDPDAWTPFVSWRIPLKTEELNRRLTAIHEQQNVLRHAMGNALLDEDPGSSKVTSRTTLNKIEKYHRLGNRIAQEIMRNWNREETNPFFFPVRIQVGFNPFGPKAVQGGQQSVAEAEAAGCALHRGARGGDRLRHRAATPRRAPCRSDRRRC